MNIPYIKKNTHSGSAYFSLSDQGYSKLEKYAASRSRFSAVVDFTRKIRKINDIFFADHFSTKFYIRADRLNDARIAMMLIYNGLRRKLGTDVGPCIVDFNSVSEENASPAARASELMTAGQSPFWDNRSDTVVRGRMPSQPLNDIFGLYRGGSSDEDEYDDDEDEYDEDTDDYDFSEYDDDDEDGDCGDSFDCSADTETLSSNDLSRVDNPRVIECGSVNVMMATEADAADDLVNKNKVLFILDCCKENCKQAFDDMPFAMPVIMKEYSAIAKEYGFHMLEVKNSSEDNGGMCEAAASMLEREGFDVSGARRELYAMAGDPRITEYDLETAARMIADTQMLEHGNDRKLRPDTVTKVSRRMLRGMHSASCTVNDSGLTLVGLSKEREKLENILSVLKLNEYRSSIGMKTGNNGCHMVFAGPPGTAKTTLARRFAAELVKIGFISSADCFVECRKSDIVGQHVGRTAKLVDSLFSRFAETGGVIFFDEIYTLTEDRDTCFDKEAVTAIIQNMENYRNKVICIFAGYLGKMESFLGSNDGIRSRITHTVKFEPYDNAMLCGIFRSIAKDEDYKLPKNCDRYLEEYFDALRRSRGDKFGNGREARNLFEACKTQLAKRLSTTEMTPENVSKITMEDLRGAIDSIISSEISEKKKVTIGF